MKQLGPKPGASRPRRLAALATALGTKPAGLRYGLAAVSYALLLLSTTLARQIAAGFQAHIPKPVDPSAPAEAVA